MPIIDLTNTPEDQQEVFVTRTCLHCHKDTTFGMTQEQYNLWAVEHNYVQDVFRHVNAQIREIIISGTHPECWNEIFTEE